MTDAADDFGAELFANGVNDGFAAFACGLQDANFHQLVAVQRQVDFLEHTGRQTLVPDENDRFEPMAPLF